MIRRAPPGITIGDMYALLYRTEPHVHGFRLPARAGGGSFRGWDVGLQKSGRLVHAAQPVSIKTKLRPVMRFESDFWDPWLDEDTRDPTGELRMGGLSLARALIQILENLGYETSIMIERPPYGFGFKLRALRTVIDVYCFNMGDKKCVVETAAPNILARYMPWRIERHGQVLKTLDAGLKTDPRFREIRWCCPYRTRWGDADVPVED